MFSLRSISRLPGLGAASLTCGTSLALGWRWPIGACFSLGAWPVVTGGSTVRLGGAGLSCAHAVPARIAAPTIASIAEPKRAKTMTPSSACFLLSTPGFAHEFLRPQTALGETPEARRKISLRNHGTLIYIPA